MGRKRSKYYISNKEMYAEVVRCKKAGLEQASPKLVDMFILLGQRIQSKMYYNNPQDKLDCFQNGIEHLLKNWKKFDTEYKNPFAYYTQTFKNGMAAGWNKIHPKSSLQNISLEGDEESGIHTL